jgi:ABC-2 type transport system ATP-binding protein
MIQLEQLSFGYRKDKRLFKQLNLQFKPGNIYGLLGKNGAGKTTLLKLMCGLLFPEQGTCTVNGYPAEARNPHSLQDIFLVTEEFYLPPLSIKHYCKIYAPFYPGFNHDRLLEYLKEFELPADGLLTTLSYGQKKKFLLAFGLATSCAYVILDEPSNGLDIPSKRQFRRLLAASLEPHRMYIISTHQVRDLENIIDPIIILDEGEIIFNQSLQDITNRLSVSIHQQNPDELANDPTILYYEKTMGGYAVIKENQTREESQVDIELLFNAVIFNKQKIKEMFQMEVSHES